MYDLCLSSGALLPHHCNLFEEERSDDDDEENGNEELIRFTMLDCRRIMVFYFSLFLMNSNGMIFSTSTSSADFNYKTKVKHAFAPFQYATLY